MLVSHVWSPASLTHEGRVVPSLARVRIGLDPFTGSQAIHYCHQCRRAPCARACPQDAIRWIDEPGCWIVDVEMCVGCGACAQACPFDALVMDVAMGRALKCDLCGGDPECAMSCPSGALSWQEKEG